MAVDVLDCDHFISLAASLKQLKSLKAVAEDGWNSYGRVSKSTAFERLGIVQNESISGGWLEGMVGSFSTQLTLGSRRLVPLSALSDKDKRPE